VSDHPSGHALFEELAAGYALDALEPADEQRFLRHVRGCPPCAAALARYRDVATALAQTAPPGEPSALLANRIASMARAAARPGGGSTSADDGFTALTAGLGDGFGDGPGIGPDELAGWRTGAGAPAAGWSPGPDEPAVGRSASANVPGASKGRPAGGAGGLPADGLPARGLPARGLPARGHRSSSRGRRWLRPAAIAAVVALLAGGGTWAGLESTASGPVTRAALCSQGCSEVVLTAAGSHAEAGKVIVSHGLVWMEPAAMAPDDTADQIYVLWQLTSDNRPLAVGSFDVRSGSHGPVVVGPLAAPYHGTLAFAVSLEHGRTIPASPSRIAALGQAS
jgi:anti-sigma-K factor RskA